ncbi:ATP-binding protein [Brevibacillus sp. GCM10020057]|uniref:PAS domain-containing sensor histidine kinase n=1 Tax=Brevibacillus sp. GCM10020057 TaxID=3317327 RepID=UPI0036361A87
MNSNASHSHSILILFIAGWIPLTAYLLLASNPHVPLALAVFAVMTGATFWFLYGSWRGAQTQTQAIKELEETRALLEAVLALTTDAMAILDTRGKIKSMNPACKELFGPPVETQGGIDISIMPADRQEAFHLARKGKQPPEREMRIDRDGSSTLVSCSFTPVFNAAGEVIRIVGRSRNLAERETIRELKASQEKYRLITENMTDMIFVYKKADGKAVFVSSSHTQQLGYPVDELRAMNPQELRSLIHPDDVEMVLHVSNRDWTVENNTAVVYRLRHREGHWVSVESRFKPLLDEAGNVHSIMIVSRDVSEVVETKELLRQSDKLSAIGQLAAGIAHEIRNPLTSLRGFVQLLQSSLADPRYCEIMLAELDRINFIVSELLVLAKPKTMKFEDKNPALIIQNVVSLLESQANMNNILFHVNLDADLPDITCDENQLKQVFINVCKNAIEALPQGGEVFLEGEQVSPVCIHIRIRDTGCGIEPSRIPRLGEPFYTTKEKGTGLGLMISQRILEDHGGSLSIESEQGKGTTVHITLPARHVQNREKICRSRQLPLPDVADDQAKTAVRRP